MNNLLNVAGIIFLIIITINVIAFITFCIKRRRPSKVSLLGQTMWSTESDTLKRLVGLSKTQPPRTLDLNELINTIKLYVNTFNVSVSMCNSVDKNIQTNLRIKDYGVTDKSDSIEILIIPNTTNVEPIVITVCKNNAYEFAQFINEHVTAIDRSVKMYMEKYNV